MIDDIDDTVETLDNANGISIADEWVAVGGNPANVINPQNP